jgi:hypothetical protein
MQFPGHCTGQEEALTQAVMSEQLIRTHMAVVLMKSNHEETPVCITLLRINCFRRKFKSSYRNSKLFCTQTREKSQCGAYSQRYQGYNQTEM